MEPFAGDAHGAPVGEHLCAHLLVEADGWGVPFEYVPLQAGAAFGYGDGGYAGEEGFADSLAAVLGADVEVFDVDAGVAAPGGVVVEVESEAYGQVVSCRLQVAGWRLRQLGDEAVEAFCGAEAVAEEVGFGGVDGVGFALVGGEVADEGEDLGDVGWRGGA